MKLLRTAHPLAKVSVMAGAAAVTITTSALLIPAAAASSGVEPAAPISTAQVDQNASHIAFLGDYTYPDTYAGGWVDEANATIHINVTQPGDATNAMAAAAGNVPLVITTVPRSLSSLLALEDSVMADRPMWAARGVAVTGAWPDAESDTVDVGVVSATTTASSQIAQYYGSENVNVVASPYAESTSSRTADSSPYNGGDEITVGTGVCTAGFGMHKGTAQQTTGAYLITAGHCFADGAGVKQNGTTIGTANRTSVYGNNGDDLETITGTSSSSYIWEQNTSRATSDAVEEDPLDGEGFCFSGAASNETCGNVTATNGCYAYTTPALTFCHLTKISSSSELVAEGDSGGPWFYPYNYSGTRYFSGVGVQSGGQGQYTCTTQLGSGQKCYETALFTPLSRVYTDFNLWVNSPL